MKPFSFLLSTMTKRFALFAAVAALGASTAEAGLVFDATADYSDTNNPNGVWSSGYSTTLGSAFQMHNLNRTEGALNLWYSSNIGPLLSEFGRNISASTFQGIAPGQLTMHPGSSGQYSILRFTAPSSGTYTLASRFFAGDIGDTDAYVLLNGSAGSPLFFTPSTGASPTYGGELSLTAGDRLDFVVGSKGDYSYDSTPLSVRLTLNAVPEPSTLLLGGLGVACGLGFRRRSAAGRRLR